MSLNIALNTAVSSLLVTQQQMAVASSNISNANTDGYTRKSSAVSTLVTTGVASSVTAGVISSKVDSYLLKSIAQQISTNAAASTTSAYYQSLASALGTVSSDDETSSSDLSSMITALASAIEALETTPDASSNKAQVVSDLDSLATSLRETSATIQDLRAQADDEIASTVDDINTQVDTIADLNDAIVCAKAAGQSTADLEDQRMVALQALAGDIGVDYYVDSSGAMRVFTSSGQALIDEVGEVHSLSYTAAASVSSSTTFDAIDLDGTDLTDLVSSGKLAALVSQRDTVLSAAQDELDSLAQSLADAINACTNQGSATIPQNTLTGTTSVSGSDSVSVASGTTVRVALTDSSGAVTSYADIDLSSATTVDDIAAALQSLSGVSASVDSSGHLVVQASDSSSGVAISTLSGGLGSDSTDLSSYFGLNDVLVESASAETIRVRTDLLSNVSLLPTGALSSDATLTTGSAAVASSSNDVAAALADALSSTHSFGAAGTLGAAKSTFSDYASSIISGVSTRAAVASSNASTASSTLDTLESRFSSESGVNTDEESANLVVLENNYAASAKVISAVQSMFESLLSAVQS